MSTLFSLYPCGSASLWTENPQNGFTVDVQGKIRGETPQAGLPPDFSGRRPRFFAFCGPFPRCRKCRSFRLVHRQVDESPKRPKIKPSKYKGVVRPFLEPLRLAGQGGFLRLPPSHTLPPNTLPAGKEQYLFSNKITLSSNSAKISSFQQPTRKDE